MIRQTKMQLNIITARKRLNGSRRKNRQFVMNVYKDQYQKFWQVAKGVGVLIYLELKHKIGMEGDDQFYKMSNHMFSSVYAVTRQRKYKAINKLLKANLIKVSKRKGKNIHCRLVLK